MYPFTKSSGWGIRSSIKPESSGRPGAHVGWLDGQDLFFDVDSAYRVAQTMAINGDGIVVGLQTLVKRLHESGSLKSADERRGKLKIRRMKMADGQRSFVWLQISSGVSSQKAHPLGTRRPRRGQRLRVLGRAQVQSSRIHEAPKRVTTSVRSRMRGSLRTPFFRGCGWC
jgi:hypothetical protein